MEQPDVSDRDDQLREELRRLHADRYRQLREQLRCLHAQPVKDMRAIDEVIDALEAEQLRLKALDGQAGNNPIEGRSEAFETR